MTTQMPDLVIFDRKRFVLAGMKGESLFELSSQGITPAMIHTACWRGFICTYATAGRKLQLRELELGSD